MKTTIEQINGESYTVVWHCPPTKQCRYKKCTGLNGGFVLVFEQDADAEGYIAIALPALPRHPKPEDAQLLYRYMAEGVVPCGGWLRTQKYFREIKCKSVSFALMDAIVRNVSKIVITHATDKDGNRVEVAIKED